MEARISRCSARRARSPEAAAPASALPPTKWLVAGGAAVLALLVVVVLLVGRRGGRAQEPVLMPGASIAQLEAGLAQGGMPGVRAAPQLPDPQQVMRDRAKALVQQDPAKAAQILKAWMTEDAPHA